MGHRIGICTPVLGELWAGIELSVSRRRNEQQLKLALSILAVWPFDDVAAADFSVIFAHLRRTGQPIPRIDIQIAAIVRTMGNCVLVTKDSDFAAVPGLVVENWAI